MISIITTVHNAERTIGTTIESILSQTYPNFEYVIVDDGSTDSTVKIIEEKMTKDNRIRLIKSSKVGRSQALNLAIKNSKYQFIANIDADDEAHPKRLEIQLDTIRDTDTALIASRARVIQGYEQITWPVDIEKIRLSPITKEQLKKTNPIPHSSVMFNLKAVNKKDLLYSENLTRVVDYELWIRLSRNNYKMKMIEEQLVSKRIHQNQSFENKNRIKYLNSVYLVQKEGFKGELSNKDKIVLVFKYIYGLFPQKIRMSIRK